MHFEYKIGPVIHYVYSLECFKEVTSPSLPLSLHSAPNPPPPPPRSLQLIWNLWKANGKHMERLITISWLFSQDFGGLHKCLLIIIYNAQVGYGPTIKALW